MTCVPSRGQRRVGQRRDGRLQVRLVARRGRTSRRRRPLEVVDARRDHDPAAEALVVRRRPPNAGTPGQRQVHLGRRSPAVRRFPARHTSVGPEVHRVEQPEQRPLRVGAGDHDARRRDLLARRPGPRPSPAPSLVGDRRPPRRRSGSPRRTPRAAAGQRLGQRPRAAPRRTTVCPAAPPSLPAESPSSTAAVPAVHGPIAVYRTPRAAIGPPDVVALERLAHQVRHRHRQDAEQPPRPAFGPSSRNARPRRRPATASAIDGRLDVGRRGRVEVGQEARHAPGPARSNARIGVGVVRRPAPEAPPRSAAGSPHSVERRRRRAAGRTPGPSGRTSSQPVPAQAEVADHRRPQPARPCGPPPATRTPGPSSAVGRAAPPDSRALQDEDAQAGLRQVGRGHQPVVAAADDDRVVPRVALAARRPPAGASARSTSQRRRCLPGRAHDPAARVGGRAAQPQVLDRASRYRAQPGHRPVEEQLLQRELALEDVALGQAERLLDVQRRQHLPVQDHVADVRGVLGDRVDHRVAERLARLRRPTPRRRPAGTGAHCTKQLMTCLPGGAIDGSTSVGMIMSMYGRREKSAVLRVVVRLAPCTSTEAANPIAPRRCSPGPGRAGEVRAGRRAPGSPCPTSPGTCTGDLVLEVRRRAPPARAGRGTSGRASAFDSTTPASISSPTPATTPDARPPRTSMRATGASRPDLRAQRPRPPRRWPRSPPPVPPRGMPHAPNDAVDLAHVVVEHHVRGARRADARGTSR